MDTRTRNKLLCALPRYQTDWQSICAILPAYLPDGTNGTEVCYLDGTRETVGARLCWVLDDLLGYLRTSQAVLARQSRKLLGARARRVPLVLHEQFCLVPVKGRVILGANDSTLGYVVLHHVRQVTPEPDGTCITFTGGLTVKVRDRGRTVWESVRRAKLVAG